MPGSSCKNTVVYKKKAKVVQVYSTCFQCKKKKEIKGRHFVMKGEKKARHTEEKLKVCKSQQSWFPRMPLYQERVICTSTVRGHCLSLILNEKPYL